MKRAARRRLIPAGAPGEPTAEEAWAAAHPWGLYVHIPFCPYKCAYCDFVAVGPGPRVARWHDPYVEHLLAEAAYWRDRLRPRRPPVSIFYGGGTPTLLGGARLGALHLGLAALFDLGGDAEVTVEANPGTAGPRDLAALRAAGVNRLSLGLQVAQDRLLAAVGRLHGRRDFVAAWEAARAAGFRNLNVDVMYGLPGQTTADVDETLDLVASLSPEHVSAYGLQVEERTPLHARAARGEVSVPGEDAAADQWERVRLRLGSIGLDHYEVSNFALPARESRHNLLYWRNAGWLGLGVGAHSHWRGARWRNTPRLAEYRDGVRARSGAWTRDHEPPDAARRRSEDAFLGLRLLREGVDLAAYARRHGVSLGAAFPGAVERLVADGLCTVSGGRLRLRPEAAAVGNRAFAAFV